MSLTYGFYNSVNHDRKYDTEQMSRLFDGIINDGVFQNIGTAMLVTTNSGNTVNIGIGRAWFNSTWSHNDTIYPITLGDAEIAIDRIDAIVLEIDSSVAVRANAFKIVAGTPSSSPVKPTLINTDSVHQHPLAYIRRTAGSTKITQADITNAIGTNECPFITGILETVNTDALITQWQDQWTQWFTAETSDNTNQMSKWMDDKQLEFNTWFSNLQTILEGDVAAKLAENILELQNRFKALATEYAVYQLIEDSNGIVINDSYNSELNGRVIYKLA